jgi:predicted Zn-dependent protease
MRRVISTFLAAVALANWTGAQPTPKPEATKIHREAYERPFDEARFRAYLKVLPRAGDYYVVEGDIPLSEDEVRSDLVAKSASTARADGSTELLLNVVAGKRDFYTEIAQRNLTYAVDRASFPNEGAYRAVVENIGKAGSEWAAICPDCQIRFTHQADQDSSPSLERTNFIVRFEDAAGPIIAMAFFPHDPPLKRVLRVYPEYFSTNYDQVGVFRHELGHVLGYRHEHIRGIAGCDPENDQWLPLTPYDPHSVMHYFCGGGGGLKLELSQVDRQTHRNLYSPPATAGLSEPPLPPPLQAARVLDLYRAAVAHPFDKLKRNAFVQSLPRQDDYYIVEGDLRMTEEEVLSYLVAQGDAPVPVDRGSELIVNLHAGARDFYRDLDQRRLTYAVDKRSFPDEERYQAVLKAMKKATNDWMDACAECKVQFVHVAKLDAAPSQSEVSFTVRYQDSRGQYIALSFFPHDSPLRRYLEVDPTYFTSPFDKVGVLRHELGHVLGYRHEHIRGVAGCYQEGNAWKPLTPYDSKSVMHYFCGGHGDLQLKLTALDREGHHKLYGSSPPTPPAGSPALVVRFEGGNVSENALRVLRLLYKEKLLPLESHTVAPGESFEEILKDHLELPGYPKRMDGFARQINNGADLSNLQIGDQVRYPNVRFTTYEFSTKLDSEADSEQIAQVRENWSHVYMNATQSDKEEQLVRVTLKGYEMLLPVVDRKKLAHLVNEINDLKSRNVVVYAREGSAKRPSYFGHHDPQNYPREDIQTFWRDRQPVIPMNLQGDLASLIDEPTRMPDWNNSCELGSDCPEIVLIDNPVSAHPDLAGAVFNDAGALPSRDSLFDGQAQRIEVDNDLPSMEHGTHLAGIIASKDNGFGLVGIHPGVRIYSWDWNKLHENLDQLVTRIDDREEVAWNHGALQIYVFATEWESNKDPQLRLTDDILARKINEEKVLVIAAAGQPDPRSGKPAEDLTIGRGFGPMNLGDLENVVVVTACSPCAGEAPRVAPWANYSKSRIVHLAAPGENIPSTSGHGHYAVASGTSQATAFVAGVASSMACYYPRSYKRISDLKTRLQVTSRPLVVNTGSEAEAAKVATGILDEKLAMLDPTRDWIQKNGQEFAALTQPFLWEDRTVTGRNSNQKEVPVALSRVYRIVHRNGKAVFYLKGEVKGEVERVGPLKLTAAELTKPLFRQGDTSFDINDLEDLLLSIPHKVSGGDS